MKRAIKWVLIIILALIILSAGGLVIWGSTPLGPSPQALQAMESNNIISVTRVNSWTVFEPAHGTPDTGLVFYPGGRVDYRSYAPLARRIAEEGYLVVLVPMPLNLAVLGTDRASAVITSYPQIEHWAVGGHSLGGAMAASYIYRNPDSVEGLVLWAAYPAANNSLAKYHIHAASVYGTRDGLATRDKIYASRPLLPWGTTWVPIEGGNHAQFGAYGSQPGDQDATISPDDQLDQAARAAITLLESLKIGR